MTDRRPRWSRYEDEDPNPPDPTRLLEGWLLEDAYERERARTNEDADDPEEWQWVSPKERLRDLLSRDPEGAWPVVLLIVERAPQEAMWQVGHELVRDLLVKTWPAFTKVIEEEARQNVRLREALVMALCCSSLAMEVLQRIGHAPPMPPRLRAATMKALSIQVQPGRLATTDVSAIAARFNQIAGHVDLVKRHLFDGGRDRVEWLNFTFDTEDLPNLWARVQEDLYRDPQLGAAMAAASIAVCEGDHGWDDYLLLYHFDPAEERDAF